MLPAMCHTRATGTTRGLRCVVLLALLERKIELLLPPALLLALCVCVVGWAGLGLLSCWSWCVVRFEQRMQNSM